MHREHNLMNPAFEKRYLASFNSFERDVRQMTGDPFVFEGVSAIREFALAETKRLKLNDLLSIDALFFLVLNLYHLVYRPAFTSPETKTRMDQVLESIQHDITLLLSRASDQKPKHQIILKDIVHLISEHYDELRSLQVPNSPGDAQPADTKPIAAKPIDYRRF